MKRIPVGVLGATGMVGQQFVRRLVDHPWFEVVQVAASPRSAGRSYTEAVAGRWSAGGEVPASVASLPVGDVGKDRGAIAAAVELVFCALDMDKAQIGRIEEAYARDEVAVVSANSAHRWTGDVPMLIPEINPEHLAVIAPRRRRLGTVRGFVAVKPNCSIQPYMPALHALADYAPQQVSVCTYQAVSGAGRTLEAWPEMQDNVIPFIGGEEDKSQREPLKIWGRVQGDQIALATGPQIGAQCVRVPVSDGHLAAVSVRFADKPTQEQVRACWRDFAGRPQQLQLPSAPDPFLRYCDEADRPQTRLDRDAGDGMAVSLGRLRPDPIFDYAFIALSHNTVRGAAGGCILSAELLRAEGYLNGE